MYQDLHATLPRSLGNNAAHQGIAHDHRARQRLKAALPCDWADQQRLLAQSLWPLLALPMWRMARAVQMPLARFCILTKADPHRFPPHRCRLAAVPTAEDLDQSMRERASEILIRVLKVAEGPLRLICELAAKGRPLKELSKASMVDSERVELIVRSFGYASPPHSLHGLAQYRQILSIEELAEALNIEIADVIRVEMDLKWREPSYRLINRRLTVEAFHLMSEWFGYSARWRTTVSRKYWWMSTEQILKKYDNGISIRHLSSQLGVDDLVLYDFLHRHHRRPRVRQLQNAARGS